MTGAARVTGTRGMGLRIMRFLKKTRVGGAQEAVPRPLIEFGLEAQARLEFDYASR